MRDIPRRRDHIDLEMLTGDKGERVFEAIAVRSQFGGLMDWHSFADAQFELEYERVREKAEAMLARMEKQMDLPMPPRKVYETAVNVLAKALFEAL